MGTISVPYWVIQVVVGGGGVRVGCVCVSVWLPSQWLLNHPLRWCRVCVCVQIEQQTASKKFEDEIRQEQEEKRQQAEEAKERKKAFKEKANMFNQA